MPLTDGEVLLRHQSKEGQEYLHIHEHAQLPNQNEVAEKRTSPLAVMYSFSSLSLLFFFSVHVDSVKLEKERGPWKQLVTGVKETVTSPQAPLLIIRSGCACVCPFHFMCAYVRALATAVKRVQ